jgi:MoaA/NifB/PqqE/SkfB family radical SAM enzyme
MSLKDWKNVIDELAEDNITSVLLRGGEVFLYEDIEELLQYIHDKGIFISIDTNGTILDKYAEFLVNLEKIHITISVDGDKETHDHVRGVKGCFEKINNNLLLIDEIEQKCNKKISKSITFTISPYSYKSLDKIPNIARKLKVDTITIVPYYYLTKSQGMAYEKILKEKFNTNAYSWKGFCHEESGVDYNKFLSLLQEYKNNLKEIKNYDYLPLTNDEYIEWFKNVNTCVYNKKCSNVEKLIDIQPNGDVNFCVDFPDYIIGNVKNSSIKELWNSKTAACFREYRRENMLPVCYRCGAKYMSGNQRY